jgi:cyclophilin family peptidyl-prolyl cis-trans isomerase
MIRTTPVLLAVLLLSGCSAPKESETQKQPPAAKAPATQENKIFKVRFTTSKGVFVVEAHRDWAPIGAQRFYDLVKDRYYDGARFFRVVPNFVIQFGLAASPAITKKWDKPMKDDPVTQTNRTGSLAFATTGKNSRTAQVFINLRSNQSLDAKGFAPFAQIIEGSDVVDRLYSGYGEAPDQEAITKRGNSYLTSKFPKLDYIKSAVVVGM